MKTSIKPSGENFSKRITNQQPATSNSQPRLLNNSKDMQREKVKSSNIASAGYDAANKHLDIEFVKGGLYRYFDVPEDKFRNMLNAVSVGKFFTAEIKNTYSSERINTLDYVIDSLTDDQRKKLIEHFDSIYECNELTDHEYKIIYLAWLWANGFVYREESGMSMIDEKNSDLPLNAFEITIEDEYKGGVNLDLMYSFYSIDRIMQITN